MELSRYVVLNPVRAEMVSQASEWAWSSHRAMVGMEPGPTWLVTDWVLGQFGSDRASAQARYAAFVADGMGQPSVWEGLRHQVFLGGESFAERHSAGSASLDRLREVPRAQRRPLAKPLAGFAAAFPDRREAMARASATGVYSMHEIADFFGEHYATVSRAVRWLEAGGASASPPSRANA